MKSSTTKMGTHAKLKRAWLITWEATPGHDKVKDKLAGIMSWRYKENTMEKFVEQIYASQYLAIFEQFAHVNKKRGMHTIQYGTLAVSQQMQEELHIPAKGRFSESIIIGSNPWLWARIVHNLETWIDVKGTEHLKWMERENIIWDNYETKWDLKERSLKQLMLHLRP